jgi:hypothetical protein
MTLVANPCQLALPSNVGSSAGRGSLSRTAPSPRPTPIQELIPTLPLDSPLVTLISDRSKRLGPSAMDAQTYLVSRVVAVQRAFPSISIPELGRLIIAVSGFQEGSDDIQRDVLHT